VSSIAYPLLVLAMTGSPATAGIVGFVGQVPYILFQLPAGALVDRVDRRRMMIACDVGRMLALASLPLAAWLGHLRLAQVIVVAFVEGSLFVFFRLGEVSAVHAVVNPDHYPTALAQNEARTRAANLLGNPIGGFLFDLGRTVPFLADAVSYLFSLATLLLIRKPFEEARTEERRHVLAEIREGIEWLLEHRYVLVVNLAASATNGLFQILSLVVIVGERQRGASASLIGILLAGFGAGGLLGTVAGGWLTRRVRPNTIVITAIWIWAVLTLLIGVLTSPVLLFVDLAALAFLGASWNIAGSTIYYRLVPDRLIGRVSSVGALTAFGALPLGALAGGLLVQSYGPGTAGLIAGAGMLVTAALTTAAPSVRRGPAL
jgi:predicted MFS family arabinose efflux permease